MMQKRGETVRLQIGRNMILNCRRIPVLVRSIHWITRQEIQIDPMGIPFDPGTTLSNQPARQQHSSDIGYDHWIELRLTSITGMQGMQPLRNRTRTEQVSDVGAPIARI